MDHPDESRTAEDLLLWFEQNKRDLPWRWQRDPYAIWVSEIMLQQTQVETVLPYYERFLASFPTVEDLAAGAIDEILGLWSGLGYYRRARLLHQAAQKIVDSGEGFPGDLEGLRSLPGVGGYTAAAVGSIAFGIAEPAIDGNVERVVGRYLGIEGDPKRGEARQRIRDTARSFLAEGRPGDSNQALMEIGATVCRPRKPRCAHCPLGRRCEALLSGRPETFAARRGGATQSRVRRRVAVVRDREKVLLFRRPEDSEQLAGMWELPWADEAGKVSSEASLTARYGGQWRFGDRLGRVRHSVTNRFFEIEIVEGELETPAGLAEGAEAGWFNGDEIEKLAVSSLVRKVLVEVNR